MIRTPVVAALSLVLGACAAADRALGQAAEGGVPAGQNYYTNPLGQSVQWLSSSQVEKELNLTPQQKEQIDEIRNEQGRRMREMFQQLRDIKQADRARKYSELQKTLFQAIEEKIQQVLSPDQQQRLKQIVTQMQLRSPSYGFNVLTSGEVAQTLGITPEQKEKLREAQVRAQNEFRQRVQDFYRQVQEELLEKVLSELTAEQRKQLDDLLGKKYEP